MLGKERPSAEILLELNESVNLCNKMFAEGHDKEAKKMEDAIKDAINEYTAQVRKEKFRELRATDDPMFEACKQFSFNSVSLKENNSRDLDFTEVELRTRPIKFDLERLDKFCGGIGKDPNWKYEVEKVNYLLCVKTATNLGVKPEDLTKIRDCFYISEIAKSLEMGEDPVSNANILASLQSIVTKMIGDEYKVNEHDVAALNASYIKRGKKVMEFETSSRKDFHKIMLEVCHKTITNSNWSVTNKEIKEN